MSNWETRSRFSATGVADLRIEYKYGTSAGWGDSGGYTGVPAAVIGENMNGSDPKPASNR